MLPASQSRISETGHGFEESGSPVMMHPLALFCALLCLFITTGCEKLPPIPGIPSGNSESADSATSPPSTVPPPPPTSAQVIALLNGKHGPEITEEDLQQLTLLGEAQADVTDLNLKSLNISAASFQPVSQLPQLKRLDLQAAVLDEDHLRGIGQLESLEWLNLSRTTVSNSSIRHLANLPSLVHLDLSETGVNDDGLAHLTGLKSLQELSINGTEIYGQGLAALGNMGARAPLKIIQATNSQIGYQGFLQFRDFTQLQEINASSASVTDASLEGLKGLRDLRVVRLAGNLISDEGLRNLVAASDLELLDISKQPGISDNTLKRLRNFKKLSKLNIENTACSLQGVQDLKKALPSCEIQFQQQAF
jgi:Leucine-rich repeat (LRR) protein